MQTTHKIAGGDAEGYATYLTSDSGRGDYYIDPEDSEGEGAAGEWHGSPSVLASLGLSADRPVQRDQLVTLMNGQAPNEAREIRATGGNGTKVAGIDMTFSPPKDVSALWAACSGEHREQIERAHKDAVASAMGHVERDVELVRVREAGNLKWQTAQSLVAAKFTHNTSRLTADRHHQRHQGRAQPHDRHARSERARRPRPLAREQRPRDRRDHTRAAARRAQSRQGPRLRSWDRVEAVGSFRWPRSICSAMRLGTSTSQRVPALRGTSSS